MTTVVAVSGSRREGSYTKAACHYALDAAAEAGVETDLVDLGDPDLELPLYHPDRDVEDCGDVAALLDRVETADGVVLGSPVYHGSYSSTFRSFHDYCSFDQYEHTVVGLLATAGGGSYAGTLDHMRGTVRGVHGHVVPHQVGIRGASTIFQERDAPADPGAVGSDSRYALTDEGIYERLCSLGYQVAVRARRAPECLPVDEPEW